VGARRLNRSAASPAAEALELELGSTEQRGDEPDGGKSPQVILSTPPDLDELISTVAAGIFNNAGQMCDAGSRLVVHEDLADAVEAGIVRAADEWAPGDPRDASTRVGAIIDEKELERVLGVIDRAVMEGARLATGGGRAEVIPGGSYLQPTVLAEVDPLSEAAHEEIFGPVLTISTFRHEEEAVELANGTRYGLAAAVWTRDLAQAARVSARIEAGSVFINGYDRAGLGVPFGGHRRSGLGVDRSLHAIDKYTRLKTTWIHW